MVENNPSKQMQASVQVNSITSTHPKCRAHAPGVSLKLELFVGFRTEQLKTGH